MYNGWENYETWLVALWLDNDRESYNHVRELAAGCRNEAPDHYNVPDVWTAEETTLFTLADQVRELVESTTPDIEDGTGLFTDLIDHSLREVDWQEIASSILSEV